MRHFSLTNFWASFCLIIYGMAAAQPSTLPTPSLELVGVKRTTVQYRILNAENKPVEIHLSTDNVSYQVVDVVSDGVWNSGELRRRTHFYVKARVAENGNYSQFSPVAEFDTESQWYPPTIELTVIDPYTVSVKFTDHSYQDTDYELYTEEPYDFTYYQPIVLPDSGQSKVFTVSGFRPMSRVTFAALVGLKNEDYPAYWDLARTTVYTPFAKPVVTFLGNTSTSIILRLQSDNEGDLELERSTSPSNGFAPIDYFTDEFEGSHDETYIDTSVSENTTYYYRMRTIHRDSASDYSTVISGSTIKACPNTGSFETEIWRDVPGVDVSAIPVNTPPSSKATLTSFQAPSNQGSNYGQRVRAFFCPSVTANYVFYIASDDKSELWLSADEDPANKVKIASVTGYTGPNEWSKYPTQASQGIRLERGRRYYIEALHKEGSGNDHLSVGMWIVGVTREFPISGSYLMKFEDMPPVTCEGNGSINWDVWKNQSGTEINHSLLNTAPDQTITLNKFESPQYFGTNYQSRVAGYICPPATGAYTFWIASDDRSELWLSISEDPSAKVKIAAVTGHAPYGSWEKYASQKSAKINLVAGQRYYIEAVHKEGSGADYVAVGWQLPDGTMERPIQGNRLSPADVTPPPSCADEDGGYLHREIWRNIPGTSVGSIPVANEPDQVVTLPTFATGTYFANDYGSRIRGYVCVPVSGSYTFWISSDDNSELWLSTSADPAGKVKIASVNGATRVQEWEKYPTQRSAPITLQAGYKYYIEALHKEANGNDHVAVGWQLPDGTMERPMPGNRLVPFTPEMETFAAATEAGLADDDRSHALTLSPNPVTNREVTLAIEKTDGATLQDADIQIMSMDGEVIYHQKVTCRDCSHYPLRFEGNVRPGIYMVNIWQNGKRFSKKLIIN